MTTRFASVWLLGALACGGDAPPPAGRRDAGSTDAAVQRFDDAGADGGGRGSDPTLPPADLVIELPYFGPEQTVEREVDSRPGRLDVHFSIDTTGSFGEEIDTLQSELSSRIIPALESRVDDVAFGVSRFEDFPIQPFGTPGDVPFELLGAITVNRRDALTAVARLDQPLGNGGDTPESGYEALYQIATGEGFERGGDQWARPYVGAGEGGVGFREGAIRTVVHVTDAPAHPAESYLVLPGVHGFADATEALRAIGVRVLGVASHESARPHLEALALDTGASVPPVGGGCATGLRGASVAPIGGRCPLVFDIDSDGDGLTDAIVDALVGLLDSTAWAEVYGQTDDRLGLVRAIEATGASAPSGATAPRLADRRPADGIDDTYEGVRPGTSLRFALRLRNTTVPPADYDQVFRLRFEIVGDGTVLDVVTIRVVVPFGRVDAGVRDAGLDDGLDDAGPDAGLDDAGLDDAGLDAGPDDAAVTMEDAG